MISTHVALLLVAALVPAADPTPPEIRLGVVAFEDARGLGERYDDLIRELAVAADPPMRFRLAVGTYGDVLHWLDRELIDVAVLTPGVFAKALEAARDGRPRCEYVVSRFVRGSHPARKPDDDSKGKNDDRRQYHSICCVAAGSSLRTADDVLEAIARRRVRLVFVDPLSSSGRLAPEFAMRESAVEVPRRQVDYSYSHTNSLRMVASPGEGAERVAFVWEGAPIDETSVLRQIPWPALEKLTIPADVVVARPGFPQAADLADRLAAHVDAQSRHDFWRDDDWRERYGSLEHWIRELRAEADDEQALGVTLDGLGQMLLHYVRAKPGGRPPRLALVLSGGGAKCAYQVGAVTALEEKLDQLRRETGEDDLRISLVVGTSGGAINALAVALGSTATPAGQDRFRQAWRSLDQRDIVRPSRLVRGNMGLWFVCIQTAVVFGVARRFINDPARRARAAIAAFFALAAVQIALSVVRFRPWSSLGENHALHHAWLWSTFGVEGAGWGTLVLGLVGLALQQRASRRGRALALPGRAVFWCLTVGLLGLPLAQLVTILCYEKTLSDGSGIERMLAGRFADLADGELADAGERALDRAEKPDAAGQLHSVGKQIIERRLLVRDLVITGSCLEQSNSNLPSDLYFYAPGRTGGMPPTFGALGVALDGRPEILLDVVMGSGSIFPMFPPRALRDFPEPGEQIELVDGGFAHNSPVEAAVRWGATHIVLIEASCESRIERRNFVQNVAGAFDHLYSQAQLIDARSREKDRVVIFSLRPEPPHVCVLDFADILIERAMANGYREAGERRFRKELGEPLFRELP